MRTPELNPVQKIILTAGALVTGAGMAMAFNPESSVNAADNTPTPTLTPTKTPIPTMTPIPTPTFDAPRATATSRANVDTAFGKELATIQAGYTAEAGKTATIEAKQAAATATIEARTFVATATAYADNREDVRANRGGFPWGFVIGGGLGLGLGLGGVAGGLYLGLGAASRQRFITEFRNLLRRTFR